MATLAKDTLYYREDHPRGYMFAAGNPAPDPQEGWVKSPDKITPSSNAFECTTPEAYEALLASERANSTKFKKELEVAYMATGLLQRAVETLTQELAKRPPAPSTEEEG